MMEKLEIRQSILVDLTYHILSHMNVNHMSNLYDPEYVVAIEQEKKDLGITTNLEKSIDHLTESYNKHLESLLFINFLPFMSSNLEEYNGIMKHMIQSHSGETKSFLELFQTIFNEEYYYFEKHMDRLSDESGVSVHGFSNHIKSNFTPLHLIGKCFDCPLEIFSSKTLNRFGRGLNTVKNRLIVAVLEPNNESDYKASIITAFHELTHNLTDELTIDYDDSDACEIPIHERLVMVFDYVMIKKHCQDYLEAYLKVSSDWVGVQVTALNYKEVFKLPESLEVKMMDKIHEIETINDLIQK